MTRPMLSWRDRPTHRRWALEHVERLIAFDPAEVARCSRRSWPSSEVRTQTATTSLSKLRRAPWRCSESGAPASLAIRAAMEAADLAFGRRNCGLTVLHRRADHEE
jgi:hypothetical protein